MSTPLNTTTPSSASLVSNPALLLGSLTRDSAGPNVGGASFAQLLQQSSAEATSSSASGRVLGTLLGADTSGESTGSAGPATPSMSLAPPPMPQVAAPPPAAMPTPAAAPAPATASAPPPPTSGSASAKSPADASSAAANSSGSANASASAPASKSAAGDKSAAGKSATQARASAQEPGTPQAADTTGLAGAPDPTATTDAAGKDGTRGSGSAGDKSSARRKVATAQAQGGDASALLAASAPTALAAAGLQPTTSTAGTQAGVSGDADGDDKATAKDLAASKSGTQDGGTGPLTLATTGAGTIATTAGVAPDANASGTPALENTLGAIGDRSGGGAAATQALAVAVSDDKTASPAALAGGPGFAAMLQAAGGAQGTGRATGASATSSTASGTLQQYDIQQTPGSSGFAAEMAGKLSFAASEGVQQAQLQLHPTDMGPVHVQIVVDGQQAQISFVAEHAATRAALEQSLPDLAGALQAQGLTLSGGGVFSQTQQQAGQQQQGNQDAGFGNGGGARSEDTGPDGSSLVTGAAGSTPSTPARGIVDLFA